MRNPWRMQDGPDNKINRNNFPMSFQYNGTFKYGKIYPIGLIRTIPGASYQIDSTLALNFMPTAFPIQTRQRAYVHFFYGRDRNFWKDYKDFVNGMNPDLVKPYLDESVTQARTGNLLDYLGVPTTIVGSYGGYSDLDLINDGKTDAGFSKPFRFSRINNSYRLSSLNSDYTKFPLSYGIEVKNKNLFPNAVSSASYDYAFNVESGMSASEGADGEVYGYYSELLNASISNVKVKLAFTIDLNKSVNEWLEDSFFETSVYNSQYFIPRYKLFTLALYDVDDKLIKYVTDPILSNQGELTFNVDTDGVYKIAILFNRIVAAPSESGVKYFTNVNKGSDNKFLNCSVYPTKLSVSFSGVTVNTSVVSDIDDSTSPYWRSGTTDFRNRIKLNAIPCRMYETIYNLYYRNPQNNPYILNGKPEYNVFIPTKEGGVDNNLYELRYRNWEDDFLTTAVQTPQQGIAPLVGLTDRGATVTLTNEDGTVTRYKTNLDENGNVTGIETTDSSEPLLTQALIDAVSYGISIEDLRNVNAMQKWLELNLRKGYQYKDIIEARWGISISYNELDLPEFIGGFTQEVGLQAVTQTTSHGEGIEGALGWQAGRMYAAGSGRSITHYCEEEGYIMALLTIVPVPNYSQLLPKHWFTRDLLDSYQPEFNHIGFQPITYKEVCPIQAFQESTENVDVLEQTFGYQRPWYEYFNQVDEVHGQFRTTFKDFLINRTFNVKPELSESFLLVDPEQVNDVFAVTTDDDKIIGAINHRITAKLPISLYAQARLE